MISEGIDYKVRIYVIKIQWVYKFHIKKSRNYKIKVHLKYIVPFSFIYRLLIKYHFHINLVKEDKFRKRAACDEYSNERIH